MENWTCQLWSPLILYIVSHFVLVEHVYGGRHGQNVLRASSPRVFTHSHGHYPLANGQRVTSETGSARRGPAFQKLRKIAPAIATWHGIGYQALKKETHGSVLLSIYMYTI